MKDTFALAVQEAIANHEKLIAESGLRAAEDASFAACGCESTWPSWYMRPSGRNARVDCAHIQCQIRRGEFRRPAWAIYFRNSFSSELGYGWLRFCKETYAGRVHVARLYWAMKKDQQFDILAAVHTGVQA